MKTWEKELFKIMALEDKESMTELLKQFLHKYELPLPGENSSLDKAMWAASQFTQLSTSDRNLLKQVTEKLMKQEVVFQLADLTSKTRQATLLLWQEMLAALSWHQLVPAGAMRGAGMLSLGTYEQQLDDASIKLNLGWIANQSKIRLLLQAQDQKHTALPEVELKVQESASGMVFASKTNQDGTLVVPGLAVNPGKYQIEVAWKNKIAKTPYFEVL